MTASPTTIRSGDVIEIRPIGPDDKPLLVEGLAHLSDESRYRRFLAPIKELTQRELRYLTEIDHRDHEALLALSADGEPIGVGRFVRDPARPGEAEVAITVVDDWQGRGVATAVLHDLVDRAHALRVEVFTALCLASNDEVLQLLRDPGAHTTVTPGDAGTLEVRVELPVASEPEEPLRHALRAAADGRLRSGASAT